MPARRDQRAVSCAVFVASLLAGLSSSAAQERSGPESIAAARGGAIVLGADYGMVCDYKTDTTAAAQAAANAAAALHGILQWPAGHCSVAGTIVIPEGVGAVQGTGSQTEGQVYPSSWAGTTFNDTRRDGDTFVFVGKNAPIFRDFAIWESTDKTAGAGISVNGYNTRLTSAVASGAAALPVQSSAGFLDGDPVAVLRDDGGLYLGRVSGAPGAASIPIAPAYSGIGARPGNAVWNMPAQYPRFTNLQIIGTYDGVRLDNATGEFFSANVFKDYAHDGIAKINQAAADSGNAWYGGNQFVDQSRHSSNAGVEWLAGGDAAFIGNKFFKGDYNFLLNVTYNSTASVRLIGNSFEEAKICAVQARQGVAGAIYNMFQVDENEFSLSGSGTGKIFCVAAGSAAKWITKVSFAQNIAATHDPTPGRAMIDINGGDQVRVAGNMLDNSGQPNSTAIALHGTTNGAVELNRIVGYAAKYSSSAGVRVLDSDDLLGAGGERPRAEPPPSPASSLSRTVADGGSAALPRGSGLIIVTDAGNSGATGVYAAGGNSVALVATSRAGKWIASTCAPRRGTASICFDGRDYVIHNALGAAATIKVAIIPSGDAN